jgi:hypothetical protein
MTTPPLMTTMMSMAMAVEISNNQPREGGEEEDCRKKHVRLSFQSPFSFLFCVKTTKIIFTKNPLANVVKKHVRLPSQPPFSFLFCAKTKKTVLTKNPLANDLTQHVRLIFSPAGQFL